MSSLSLATERSPSAELVSVSPHSFPRCAGASMSWSQDQHVCEPSPVLSCRIVSIRQLPLGRLVSDPTLGAASRSQGWFRLGVHCSRHWPAAGLYRQCLIGSSYHLGRWFPALGALSMHSVSRMPSFVASLWVVVCSGRPTADDTVRCRRPHYWQTCLPIVVEGMWAIRGNQAPAHQDISPLLPLPCMRTTCGTLARESLVMSGPMLFLSYPDAAVPIATFAIAWQIWQAHRAISACRCHQGR